MPNTTPEPTTAPPPAPGLLARVVGVIFAPRTTYASVAGRPHSIGVLIIVLAIVAATTGVFLSTEVGKRAYVDQALTMMESFGATVTDQMLERIEAQAPYSAYTAVGSQMVAIPLLAAILAGLSLALFNAVLGATATFRQAFAIVSHSYVLIALQALFSMPLNYARESLASTTSLAIFLPLVDDATLAGRLLGSIDLFRIWWIVSLSIGFGVLYKKRTGPIAWSLLAIYVAVVLIIAGVRSALSGA